MITGVYFGGSSVDLNTIAYDCSITIGRRDHTTAYAPSSCRMTFYDVVATPYTALVGKTLRVQGAGYKLFGGYITDVRLTVATATSGARCDIIAAGPSSRLGLITVGGSGYAAQTIANRCAAIANDVTSQDATFTFANETGTDEGTYTLSAYSSGATTATTALQNTLDFVNGCLYDNPYGGGETGRVSYFTPDCSVVSTLTPASSSILFAPTFEQSGQIINDVTVNYNTGTILRSSTLSQTLYGKRSQTVTTTIDNATHATDLADELIARVRRPRWAISDVTIEQPLAGSETLYTRIGGKFTITNLPTGAPRSTYTGIVQGWEHRIASNKFRTTFYLADPNDVGLALLWNEIPSTSAYRWNTIDPNVIWDNALTIADITA
ncbi:MAG: hypothetical protein ACR2JV_01970 [Gaiellales bacterium]